jgi:hypothetical protein
MEVRPGILAGLPRLRSLSYRCDGTHVDSLTFDARMATALTALTSLMIGASSLFPLDKVRVQDPDDVLAVGFPRAHLFPALEVADIEPYIPRFLPALHHVTRLRLTTRSLSAVHDELRAGLSALTRLQDLAMCFYREQTPGAFFALPLPPSLTRLHQYLETADDREALVPALFFTRLPALQVLGLTYEDGHLSFAPPPAGQDFPALRKASIYVTGSSRPLSALNLFRSCPNLTRFRLTHFIEHGGDQRVAWELKAKGAPEVARLIGDINAAEKEGEVPLSGNAGGDTQSEATGSDDE